jgi:hypothetical protein
VNEVKPWDAIHRERAALAMDLANLSDEQWQTRSQCGDWTVQQMLDGSLRGDRVPVRRVDREGHRDADRGRSCTDARALPRHRELDAEGVETLRARM